MAHIAKRSRREQTHDLVETRERDRSVEPFGFLTEEPDLLATPAVFGEERLPAGWIETDRDFGTRLVLLMLRQEPP